MAERSSYINVDELVARISLDRVAAFYGVTLPDLKRVGDETRAQCFLHCGKTEDTGDRALAIQTEHVAKPWKCHQYGCGKGGNLISLCDFLKPGPNAGGRPRGDRFKQIAEDLRAMADGALRAVPAPPSSAPPRKPPAPKRNVPLARSDNERARTLTELDSKFVVDPAAMPPSPGSYVRRRPFLTPEASRKWRCGYLPRDAGEDKSGGTMRGTFVYPILSEAGEVLTWFGRDTEYEAKHARWVAGGKADREPEKFHFVKGFHRGLELFGQQASRLKEPEYRERIRALGVIVVEGSNDVIALDALGVPAVGLCSNGITAEQVEKVARFARQVADGKATVMLDCDEEGERGAQHAVTALAEECRVRLAWSSRMYGGRFKGRQPESLTAEEWEVIRQSLVGGS